MAPMAKMVEPIKGYTHVSVDIIYSREVSKYFLTTIKCVFPAENPYMKSPPTVSVPPMMQLRSLYLSVIISHWHFPADLP